MFESSGGVDPTGNTEMPVTGTSPTVVSGTDSSGGPEIPGPPAVPQIEEPPEEGFVSVPQALATAAAATGVAIGVTTAAAAGVAASPAVAAAAAGAAAVAFIVTALEPPKVLAQDEGEDTGSDDGDPVD